MAQDVSANGVQVVGGSNPPCPTNSNTFPQNDLAVPSSPRSSVSAEALRLTDRHHLRCPEPAQRSAQSNGSNPRGMRVRL